MGITHVTVRIVNPADSQRYSDFDFLVDSGAIYTFIPKNVLALPIRRTNFSPFARTKDRRESL